MLSHEEALRIVEFGDFQTPTSLAADVCRLLVRQEFAPASVLEPTCGIGSFLAAALDAFPSVRRAIGMDINPNHLRVARATLEDRDRFSPLLVEQDFFSADWDSIVADLPEPLLVLGNPPWVTNSQVAALGGSNLPEKTNFGLVGLEAVTGRSNFDISEWMVWCLLESLSGRRAHLAMLCKTAVARKVLERAWKANLPIRDCQIHRIDALGAFGASVDACLLVCDTRSHPPDQRCLVFHNLEASEASGSFGLREDSLVADLAAFDRWRHLQGCERYRWRSGIKHDCSAVMELRTDGHTLVNGLGEVVEVEPDYLYPMAKGSEIANGRHGGASRWMLVPQRYVGDSTAPIERRAPRTWAYLDKHAELLDRRASSIYRNKPRFSIFGIGEYSFAKWKVAIAGLYKKLAFQVVGPAEGKPTMLDDTSYFIACRSKQEAHFLASLLNGPTASEFYSAFVFWDQKRPVTATLLRRLDLVHLARQEGCEAVLNEYLERHEIQPSLGLEA